MQLMEAGKDVKPSPIAAARNIVHSEGILGLFAGLPAGLARQAVYTTLRVGLYDIIRPLIVKNGEQPNMGHRAASGLIAGGIASFMTCPVEICMVRMQGDGRLPPSERRNYKSFFDALVRIPREEGLFAYWKGASPTVFRAMVVSMTQLGTYDQVKSMLLPTMGDGFPLHVVSAVSAAVVYSYASLPLDTVKTRMQSAKATDGKATIVGSLKGIIRDTGVKGLWTGFGPYFARRFLFSFCLPFCLLPTARVGPPVFPSLLCQCHAYPDDVHLQRGLRQESSGVRRLQLRRI
jgi:solute carrier family 25 oxoglutarate transporter 11